MAERETPEVTAIRVKVIQDSGASLAGIVKDPTNRPWDVCEEGTSRPLPWQVIIYIASDDDPTPVLFESRDAANAWVKKHPQANQDTWDALQEQDPSASAVDVDDAVTRHYCKIADEHDPPLPHDSREAFELAVKDPALKKVFNSIVFYQGYGCQGIPPIPPFPVPSPNIVNLPWLPLSCRYQGSSVIYGSGGRSLSLSALDLKCWDYLPFDVYSARSL